MYRVANGHYFTEMKVYFMPRSNISYPCDIKGYNVNIHTFEMGTNTAIVSQDLQKKIILGITLNHDLLITVILRQICFQTNETEARVMTYEIQSISFEIQTFLDNRRGTGRSEQENRMDYCFIFSYEQERHRKI